MPRKIPLAALALLLGAVPAAADPHLERAPLLDKRLHQKAPAAPDHVRAARAEWARSAELSVDRIDGGLRWLGRTDGYLSGPAAGSPREVALRWAARNLDVLGLERSDLRGLRLAHRYRAPNGVTRLIFQQRFRGIPAFDDTLRVNVARDGRIVSVGGSPKSAIRLASVRPELSAERAILAGAAAVGAPRPDLRRIGRDGRVIHFAGRHNARLVIASTGPRTGRLAWRIWFEASSSAAWSLLVDARSGRVLRRANKVKFAKGLAWDYYPAAPLGGEPHEVDFTPWLTEADRLRGNYTHVYNDFDGTEDFHTDMLDPTQSDGDIVMPQEEIRPSGDGEWMYEYMPIPSPTGFCPEAGCVWNHLVNWSWLPNRDQDGTQVFFFVNRFADHLAAPPISFNEAAGNFQFQNTSGQGLDNDGIYASNMDAAGQVAGRPIPVFWSDNANMLTRPDGQSPRMQMFLFEPLPEGTGVIADYPFSDVSGGSDATVVYHEFTHGLSNRLVIDAEGEGALDAAQSGAMGEAWSDFYAMDFLLKQDFLEDTEAPGEVKVGVFVDGGQDLVRTEAIDCTLGAPAEICTRKRSPLADEGGGGYTYEHFGRVAGSPAVHSDGEIWSQTLMDLRRRLVRDHGEQAGAERIELYVTRAMELSPEEPSYIDMRNAILQADMIAGARDQRRIWEAFAARGMGASASAADGSDTAPIAGFDLPVGLPAADMAAPVVTVGTPAEGGAVRVESGRIAGTAVDDAGVTSLTLDGQPLKLRGTKWSVKLKKLKPGRHSVTVVASDVEGRKGTVVRSFTADARRPRFRRVSARVRGGRLIVGGVVRDDSRGRWVRVGRKRVPVSRSGRFFLTLKKMARPSVRVVAIDLAGRRAAQRVRVR